VPSIAASSSLNFQAILKRCGGDAKFANALIARFRSQAASDVSKMEQLLLAGDADGLARAAHSMKSAAAYVSADAASDAARQIEATVRGGAPLSQAEPLVLRLREEILKAESWFAQTAIAA